jgi:hypothetical protein
MNDLTTQDSDQFRRAVMAPAGAAANVGAVSIESERAVAEARGQIQLAKMFPRSVTSSITEFMDACRSPEFAAAAFYSVPNRGSGPSIRFAEEAARCYGNFEYGHRELSRSAGKSEVEVYAWDKEKNNRSVRQITVEHVIDTKNGPKPCRDQSEIDNLIANKASKQIRGRILALLPKHMTAAGIAECAKTAAGGNEKPLRERIQGVVNAFSKYGVTIKRIEAYLGHGIDDTTSDELVNLIGIGNALKEGGNPSEYFPIGTEQAEPDSGAPKAIADAAAAGRKSQAQPAATGAGKPTRGAGKPAENAGNAVKDGGESVAKKGREVDADQPSDSAPTAAPTQAPTPAPTQPPAASTDDEDEVF